MGLLSVILAALAALASGLTGFNSKTLAVTLAIFGVGVPAIMAAIEKWGEATTDGERAELHERSWSSLSALRDDIPVFQAAIDAHDLAGAEAYAERVFAVLRSDHAGFAASQGQSVAGAAAPD